MYFELIDGKPRFAIAKTIVTEHVDTPEGTKEIQKEIYIFSEEELSEYPNAELIEQPAPEILSKAKQLEGKTLSKSEFEKLLFGTNNDIEQRIAELEEAIAMLIGGGLGA